jgi:hypothetical protein
MEVIMEDKDLVCIQCGNSFLFTVAQQERFKALGFDEPRRCKECRKRKEKTGLSRHEEKMRHKSQGNNGHWEHVYQVHGMRNALIVSNSKSPSHRSRDPHKERGR